MKAMLEGLNHTLQQLLSAPPDLSGGALSAITALAEWTLYLVPVTLLALWFGGDARDRRASVAAGLSGAVALMVAGAVSSVWFHPRPFMVGAAANFLDHARDSSFPSDHATVMFAVAASFSFTRPRARWLAPAFFALAAAVGWARIALGAHWPVDILGGAALGSGLAALVPTRAGAALTGQLTHLGEAILKAMRGDAARSEPD